MGSYRDKRIKDVDCPLCRGFVYIYIYGDRREDSRIRCGDCGLEYPGYFYVPHNDHRDYTRRWNSVIIAITRSVLRPCVFCSLDCNPWHLKCSKCFLKNEMLSHLMTLYESIENMRKKLERV